MDRFVGKRIDGRYEIQEIIGVGGMAVVYKAFDNQESRIVAIKILKEEFISNEEFIRRFKNESKAIAMLSHPNIVKVFDVSFGDLIQYIVMEYIEGITLKEYIEREGSLRWKDAIYFTAQILKALQHAHDKGIVHRDVKPQNIMVLPDGSIKVTDFGIARFARSEQRTITDKAIGSVHYISPEQARGEKTDERTDIYSVGVMLYEMLTGQLPFEAESAVSVAIMQLQREPKFPTEINGSIPPGLEQITMHAMQKTCERRYQSAAEMLSDLIQFRKDPSLTFEYNYYVDNAPTKFIPEVKTKEPETVRERKEEPNEEPIVPEEEEKNTMIPILAGIAVTLVIAIAVLAFLFVPKLFFGKTEEITVPKFLGLTYEEVENNDEYTENFTFKKEEQYNPEKAGVIFKQSKDPDEKVKKGAEIVLYVSKGQEMKTVPNLVRSQEAEAVSLLGDDFLFEKKEVYNEEFEEGVVVDTDPKGGEQAPLGSKIILYINGKKPENPATVPRVLTKSPVDAEILIKKENLVPEFIGKNEEKEYITGAIEKGKLTLKDEYANVGLIFRVEPAQDSVVTEGTTVKAYVSSGVKFDFTVDLPRDLSLKKYTVSLFNGMGTQGKAIAEKTVKSGAKTHTFKDIISVNTTETYTVQLSANGKKATYQTVTVDFKTGYCYIDTEDGYAATLIPPKEPVKVSSSEKATSSVVSETVSSEPPVETSSQEPPVETSSQETPVETSSQEPPVETSSQSSSQETETTSSNADNGSGQKKSGETEETTDQKKADEENGKKETKKDGKKNDTTQGT